MFIVSANSSVLTKSGYVQAKDLEKSQVIIDGEGFEHSIHDVGNYQDVSKDTVVYSLFSDNWMTPTLFLSNQSLLLSEPEQQKFGNTVVPSNTIFQENIETISNQLDDKSLYLGHFSKVYNLFKSNDLKVKDNFGLFAGIYIGFGNAIDGDLVFRFNKEYEKFDEIKELLDEYLLVEELDTDEVTENEYCKSVYYKKNSQYEKIVNDMGCGNDKKISQLYYVTNETFLLNFLKGITNSFENKVKIFIPTVSIAYYVNYICSLFGLHYTSCTQTWSPPFHIEFKDIEQQLDEYAGKIHSCNKVEENESHSFIFVEFDHDVKNIIVNNSVLFE